MLTVESFWRDFLNLPLPHKQTPDTNYLLAYSGGCDSHVLLHLFASLKQTGVVKNVKAIHVNHQLHTNSDSWASHCFEQCKQYNIACDVVKVNIDKKHNKGLEAAARTARYAVFEQLVTKDTYLLTAQHADDQLETFLLQSLRGSGVKGLSSMPIYRQFGKGFLCRPLLSVNQQSIVSYAKKNALDWIDDPSNLNTDYDRNFLRHKITPVLKQRWPSVEQTFSRVTQYQAEAAELNDELAKIDLSALQTVQEDQELISIEALKNLSVSRQKNVLRFWISQVRKLTMPDHKHLMRILNEIIVASTDAQPRVAWHDTVVRRFQGNLYAQKDDSYTVLAPIESWMPEQVYSLKGIDGANVSQGESLVTHAEKGKGLSIEKVKDKKVSIRFRQGGEVCCPQGRGQHHHKLKNLFQEWQVEPWMRDKIPLVFVDEVLAQVVGYCVCEPFVAQANEPSYNIVVSNSSSNKG